MSARSFREKLISRIRLAALHGGMMVRIEGWFSTYEVTQVQKHNIIVLTDDAFDKSVLYSYAGFTLLELKTKQVSCSSLELKVGGRERERENCEHGECSYECRCYLAHNICLALPRPKSFIYYCILG